MENNIFNQNPFQCRMDWGTRGVEEAAKRGDIIIIVDILSFSTAVTTAVHFGAIIYPLDKKADSKSFAELIGAEVAFGRTEAKELNKPSLSPASFGKHHEDKKIVLPSVNGAACSVLSDGCKALLVGSFLNATFVAEVAEKIQKENNASITVIACGERWSDTKELRPCVEDYLGAGIILSKLSGTKSPEAQLCISAFKGSKESLNDLVIDCSSGRELISMGFGDDIKYSTKVDSLKEVPILEKNFFKKYI